MGYKAEVYDFFKTIDLKKIQNLKQNMEDFKRELEKMYKGDWKNFYEKGTEMIKREAEKNLRKIYKLYDLAK